MDQPGPSQTSFNRVTGMRGAKTALEWQLQAVLFKARLTQYFEIFISQGGDDIDQIMQCDETEFLEIMSLVGMSSKPLHVRRLQRALVEFSRNRLHFLQEAIGQIGPPPINASSSMAEGIIDTFRFLIPGLLPTQLDIARFPPVERHSSSPIPGPSGLQSSTPNILPSPSALLFSRSAIDLFESFPNEDPNILKEETGGLSVAEVNRIALIVAQTMITQPTVSRRESKRKLGRDVMDVLSLPVDSTSRLSRFRQLTSKFGRLLVKRKAHEDPTHEELLLNEAATRIALAQPAFLTRREEMFDLAKRILSVEIPKREQSVVSKEPKEKEEEEEEGEEEDEEETEEPSRKRSRPNP